MPAERSRKRPRPAGRLIIIGIGNPYRSDDAVGLLVAQGLREKVESDVIVLERDGEPTSLIEAFESAEAVIMIDAVSSGAPPGALHVINVRDTPLDRHLFRHSTHSFGVADAVELAKTLGKAPPTMWIVGIEGKSFAAGTDVSPESLDGVERATAAVLRKIDELGW